MASDKKFDREDGISKTRMLLVTLSTTLALAMKKPLPNIYYEWTEAYLKTVVNDDGTSPPNIAKFLKYISTVKKANAELSFNSLPVELSNTNYSSHDASESKVNKDSSGLQSANEEFYENSLPVVLRVTNFSSDDESFSDSFDLEE
jgi:hypothetical protein